MLHGGDVDAQGIRDSVGGDESYPTNGFLGYRNLPADDVKAFNKLTDTGDGYAIKLAVQGIYSQYNNAMELNQVFTQVVLQQVNLYTI